MEMSAISGGPLAVILGTSVTINIFLSSGAKTESPGSPDQCTLPPLFNLMFLNYFLFFSLRAKGHGKWLHGLCDFRDLYSFEWNSSLSYYDAFDSVQQWHWCLGIGSKCCYHFQICREWGEHDSEQRTVPLARVWVFGWGWSLRPDLVSPVIFALRSSVQTLLSQSTAFDHCSLLSSNPNKCLSCRWGVVKPFSHVLLCFIKKSCTNKVVG